MHGCANDSLSAECIKNKHNGVTALQLYAIKAFVYVGITLGLACKCAPPRMARIVVHAFASVAYDGMTIFDVYYPCIHSLSACLDNQVLHLESVLFVFMPFA